MTKTLLYDGSNEECRSIPSERKMWELDEVREPLILISTMKIHHMGVSYPTRCQIIKGPPTKVKHNLSTVKMDRDHESPDPSLKIGTTRNDGENKSLVGKAAENHRGQLLIILMSCIMC